MRILSIFGTMLVLVAATPESSTSQLWTQLKSQRDQLPSYYHQEFDVSNTFKTAHGDQSSKWQLTLDAAPGRWRTETVSGSGATIRIFDGQDLFMLEAGGDEYVRAKRRSKRPGPGSTSLSATRCR